MLEEARGSWSGCSSYLMEQVIENEGRNLARQDLAGHCKDFGFYFKHDEREYDIIWFML